MVFLFNLPIFLAFMFNGLAIVSPFVYYVYLMCFIVLSSLTLVIDDAEGIVVNEWFVVV